MHIILERPDQNVGVMYSYPAILDEGTYLNRMMLTDFNSVSEVYKKCKQLGEHIINLSEYDISTNEQRSFTAASPIIVKEEDSKKFNGAIIWESFNITKIFDDVIIPKSYIDGKYPFIQIRMPEFPSEDNLYDPSDDSTIIYPSINYQYYDKRPQQTYVTVSDENQKDINYDNDEYKDFMKSEFKKPYPLGEILYES